MSTNVLVTEHTKAASHARLPKRASQRDALQALVIPLTPKKRATRDTDG